METLKVYSIFDSKVNCWTPLVESEDGAKNYFEFVVNASDSDWALYSEDFILFDCGDFNLLTGSFDLHEPAPLGSLSMFKLGN